MKRTAVLAAIGVAAIALRFATTEMAGKPHSAIESQAVRVVAVHASSGPVGAGKGDARIAVVDLSAPVAADRFVALSPSPTQAAAGVEASASSPASALGNLSGGADYTRGDAAGVVVPDTRKFVEKLYRDFFAQAGDPRAVEMWASLIDAGTITPEQAVETFLDSAHNYLAMAPVARLYLATFQRTPDFEGLGHWRDALLAGGSLEEIGAGFSGSQEFAARYGSLDDAAFIEQAYRNALDREPTDAERMQWRAQVGADTVSRGRMLLAISESEEFRQSVRGEVDAVMLYAGLLGRAADAPGLAGWMGFLDEGRSRSALIRGFLASAEYRGRLAGNGGRTGG